VIPEGHPCPELARPPEGTSLWDDGGVAPLALRLPTPVGMSVRVTQGNDGRHSHMGDERFAWDFGVPLETAVVAAAAGVVVWVEDASTSFGVGPEFRSVANFVVVDHGGGLFTSYVHLSASSANVAPGDVVAAGDELARTGLSGQMNGPHLHFQVENVWSSSVPARFADDTGCTWLPVEDELVVAWAPPLAASEATSEMPAETFAAEGVSGLEGFPARLFERGERPRVSGRATLEGASEVWFLVLPAAGGAALHAQRFAVEGGAFAGRLELGEVTPGQYGIALVAGRGGPVEVARSVRAAVVE
jgi:hypothetical protein